MENLEIKVSKKTRMVDLPKQFITVDGENLQSKIIFSFIDEFVKGQARLEYEINNEKKYLALNKENETYTLAVSSILTKEGYINMQLVIDEDSQDETLPVFKSNKFYLYCNPSINAVDEEPESSYELWIQQADKKLNEVDNLDISIKNSVITITNKNGESFSENVKGDKGEKGDPGAVKMQVVDTLPDTGETDTIYLLKKGIPSQQNLYDEYVYTETSGWEHIGDTSVDLTDYYTKEETDEKIEGLYTLCIERFGGSNPFDVTSDEQVKISTIINDAYVKGLHTINLLIYSKSSSRSMILNIANANMQAKPTSINFNGVLVVDGLNYKVNGLCVYINGTWNNDIFTCTSATGRWAQNEIYIANSMDYISKTNTTSISTSYTLFFSSVVPC